MNDTECIGFLIFLATKRRRIMKSLYINKSLQNVSPDKIHTFDDIVIILEICSKMYRKILHYYFLCQSKVEDDVWKEIYPSVYRIAKEVECSQKTVHRFNFDAQGLVRKKNRFKEGKQISNIYTFHKKIFQYFKAFNKFGLWRYLDNPAAFKMVLNGLKKTWEECGCDEYRFMNKIYNRKFRKSNEIKQSYEQSEKKMSVGDPQKCPTTSLLPFLNRYSTGKVPINCLEGINIWLSEQIKGALRDMDWYLTYKPIDHPIGFFANRLKNQPNYR